MTLPTTTPAAAIGAGAPEPSAFLGRQPILDRNQQLVGYELLYRADATASEALVTDDVTAAHQAALRHGAGELAPPTQKPWGQTVSFVRAPDGTLIELCTPVGG